jgi:hypothetical protein
MIPCRTVSPHHGAVAVPVPGGALNTVVSTAQGRLCKVLITAAGTAPGFVTIYDNSTTSTGTIVGMVPGSAALGTIRDFDMPVASGIVVAGVANGPALTLSYD